MHLNYSLVTFQIAQTEADLQACLEVRRRVFVVEQSVPEELEVDEYESVSTHVLVRAHRQPIGAARFRASPSRSAKFERVAIVAPARGLGLGARLMRELHRLAREAGYDTGVLSAQVPVISFYERLGYIAEGPVYMDAGIPHRTMRRGLAFVDTGLRA